MHGGWKQQAMMALEGDHPRIGRSLVFFLQGLIVLSVLTIGIGTLPDLPPWLDDLLAIEEILVVAVFTVEYVVRIAAAPRPLAYVFSFWGLIDLLAILPSYVMVGTDMRAVRAMRLLRLFRLLKLVRYSSAADRIASAVRAVAPELAVFLMASMLLVYVCALCIYYFEHDAQPKAFASVFHSMWWAAVTLTTVGYGDVYPITAGGQIFTVFVLFLALGIVAIPTGLIASALSTLRHKASEGQSSATSSDSPPQA